MTRRFSRRGFLGLTSGALGSVLLSACSAGQGGSANQSAAKQGISSSGIDYKVLVNWEHKLPDGWEANINLVEEKSLLYDEPVRTERKAYEAWRKLKEELAQEGVFVELDSCYRSVADQQDIWDEFTKKYGEEYVKSHVGVPGYSEHHTGLALDLFLVIDGRQVYENEEMVQHPEVWEKVHAKLADHGFILRYLPRKAMFTHASYEPWHIRYLDDPAVARQIVAAGQTYEEYLGAVNPAEVGCAVDYLHDVAVCQRFARLNRETMAEEIVRMCGLSDRDAFHTVHNYIDVGEMILRKGAIAAHAGELVLIPLNMRDGSVLARGRGNEDWNFSAPHGAGRLMSRTAARERLSVEEYRSAMAGVYTTSVCEATLDEAPGAYKSAEDILGPIAESVDIVEVMRPTFNFKAS